MLCLALVLTIFYSTISHGNNFLQECARYYRPKNYLEFLPHLNLPYKDRFPIPNAHQLLKINPVDIHPSPVVTTKVLTLKTKYVYKNPVCVKYSRKQKFCQSDVAKNKDSVNKLITKDLFVKNSNDIEKRVVTIDYQEDDVEDDQFNLKVSFDKLESSELRESAESRSFRNPVPHSRITTPFLTVENINEMLIEDRLDQLETILPDYTRQRAYETKTIFVTKTISNRRRMATLVVKNCVPLGYDICPKKSKSGGKSKKKKRERSSKIAREANNSGEKKFFYG